jgi:hypothetical protein
MTDLRENHCHHMTPRTKGPRLSIDPGLARKLGHEIRRNEFDDLSKDRNVGAARLFGFFLFHPLPCGRLKSGNRAVSLAYQPSPVGRLWMQN